jgi:hypothetical protein
MEYVAAEMNSEGDMDDHIRADTDKLKTHSKNFESSAGVFAQAGKEILALASGLPSYDGQLSAPARAAALEINRQCQEMHGYYAGDAQSLVRTAQAFETVDNQVIYALRQNQFYLASENAKLALFSERPPQLGNAYLGYRDDQLSDTVILCMYGVCRKVIRKGNEKAIEEFEKRVVDYDKDSKDEMSKMYGIAAWGVLALGAMIAVGLPTAGAGTLIAAGGIFAGGAVPLKLLQDAYALTLKDVHEAAYYWNILFGEDLPGDDKQSPIDVCTRKAKNIYEP